MKTTFCARFFQGGAVVAMLVTLAGCYTLLKHPRFETDEGNVKAASNAPITYADDCASCHESGAFIATHGYGPPPPPGYDRWYYYYEYPWWIPYYTDRDGEDGGNASEGHQRPFGRRHRGADDENQPAQTATSGSSSSSSPSIISKSRSDTEKEEPKPAEKDDKRDDRRGGNTDERREQSERRERKP